MKINNEIGKERTVRRYKPRKVYYKTTTMVGVKDILFGRGISKHFGNRFFRNYVDLIARDYFDSTTRMGKTKIISETMLKLSVSGYRFLRENDQGQMSTLDSKTCRAKVCYYSTAYNRWTDLITNTLKFSHALRDRCTQLNSNTSADKVGTMEFKKTGLNVVQYAERVTRGDIQRELLAKSNNAIPDSSRRCRKSKNSKDTMFINAMSS
jgi:hypothetical protein